MTIRIEPADPASPEAQALLNAYFAELAATFPNGFDPGGPQSGAKSSADPDEMSPPNGIFLVVRDEESGQPSGCGGVKLLAHDTAEIKRMWLAPSARGRGIGGRLLAALEQAARDLGARQGRLDTNETLQTAIALYEKNGWRRIPPYNDNGYATHWFAKDL